MGQYKRWDDPRNDDDEPESPSCDGVDVEKFPYVEVKTFTGSDAFDIALRYVRNMGCGLCTDLLVKATVEYTGGPGPDFEPYEWTVTCRMERPIKRKKRDGDEDDGK